MRARTGYAALLACGSILFAVSTFYGQNPDTDDQRDLAPSGRGIGTQFRPGEAGNHLGAGRFTRTPPGYRTLGNGIYYHGGPVILNTTNVYFIWYGNWANNTATTILPDLASSIGGSSYFNINTTYYDGSGNHVSNAVQYGGSTTDNYSQGTSLSDSAIQAIVASALSSGRLPPDTNGVYFVLTSADVRESSGFCSNYCGWHTYGTINGSDIKYAFVGNGDRCPSACEEQTTSSPNNNPGADGMASVISHELEESVTDPLLNAWYDRRGYENADKCAWTFGNTYTVSNGSLANMTLGTRDFLIQRNWVNASGGYCALSY